ncbi:phenylalanine--tRNA ligase subunit beta [Metamycoplasma buccale]|uniref:phenylalanine--tRNA ligase subunit beta n=1 Tax=Metamycoplasma buccale TaxID=55602 RepID=UPI00398E9BED
MLFSYKKLIELANLKNVNIDEVVNAINSLGFEVEDYWKFSDVEGLKFAHVLKTYKNPNAARLTVCELELYNDKKIIQTTATNVKENDYLMAFVPGSRSKKTVFGPKTLQGIISEGMLVGLHEIGFNPLFIPKEFDDQIFTFKKVDLSLDPIEYFDLDDFIIDVTILSNRADALCYLVMANELTSYFQTKTFKINGNFSSNKSNFKIEKLPKEILGVGLIETNKIKEITLKEKMFLWKNEMRTDNNVSAINNLTFLYTGVLPWVYDKDLLKSSSISYAFSSNNILLNNQKLQLNNNLVAINNKNIIALQNVDICDEYKISQKTKSYIFSFVFMVPFESRKNIKLAKIENSFSPKLSKECSLGNINLALDFISNYLGNGILLKDPLLKAFQPNQIKIDYSYIEKYAGFEITKTKKFTQILEQLKILGFIFSNDKKVVTCPFYRYDLKTNQDLAEEIFRLYGYENFVSKEPNVLNFITSSSLEPKYLNAFKNKGYINVRTFTLIKPENNIFNPFNFKEKINAIMAKNYDHSEIRNSFIYSLSEVMLNNKKQGMPIGSYFEIGMINNKSNVLGLVSNEKPFNEIKRDIISLTNKTLIFKRNDSSIFHPNFNASIFCDDKLIGYLAKIHPRYLNDNAIYGEIFLDDIASNKITYHSYNHLPLKTRDLTINVKPYESIEKTIAKINNIRGINSIKIIDKYHKPDDSTNITLSITLEEWATKKFDKDFNEK